MAAYALRVFSKRILQTKCDSLLKDGCTSVLFNRFLNYLSKEYNEKDPAPLFFNKEVQSLMKTLTRVDLNKVYRKRKLGDKKLEIPTYKFVSEDQLHEMLREAEVKADELLQMPPVLKLRQHIDRILSKDPALQGLDTAKFVFTDITFGIKNNDRFIVVRETDGTLREADWPLRDRMNQVYFPVVGRKLRKPLMFEEPYFERLLTKKEYLFILDRSCIQFEPDDFEYQKVTSITYQHINDNNDFDILRSTRHFGPLVFFLAWQKDIDNLLLDLIQTSYIKEANTLLKLHGQIHNIDWKITDVNSTEIIEKYIKETSSKRAPLELALQAYKELQDERRSIEHDIKHAHGVA